MVHCLHVYEVVSREWREYRTRNLVVTNKMIDVERGSILFVFTDVHMKCGCLEEAQNVFDRLQNRDVEAWNTLFSTLEACGSIRFLG